MKLIIPLLACLFAFSCSDEFRIRTKIEGRWKIESISWTSLDGAVQRVDSLLIPQNAFIEFGSCDRSDNQHPGCDAEIFLLNLTLRYRYRVLDERISFIPNPSATPGEIENRVHELFVLGGENFRVSGDIDRDIRLEKQGLINTPILSSFPVNVRLKLLRAA